MPTRTRKHRRNGTARRATSVSTPQSIKKHLDSIVVGQEQTKRQLAVAVTNHYSRTEKGTRYASNPEFNGVTIEKSNVLLIGPTGTGKTHFARALAQKLNVPFSVGDATSLTEAGYVGQDVENLLVDLIEAADHDIEEAENGIVYLDEFDKLRTTSENVSITRDVGGQGVQQALLKMLEGTKCRVPLSGGRLHPDQQTLSIDTTNILFICGGAFVGLDDVIAERLPRCSRAKLREHVLPHDLVRYGMIPELVGRIPIIAALAELTLSDMQAILTEPQNALLKQFSLQCQLQGFQVEFTKCAIKAFATAAMKLEIGARGLRSVVETVMTDLQFEAKRGSRYVVNKDVVSGKKKAVTKLIIS